MFHRLLFTTDGLWVAALSFSSSLPVLVVHRKVQHHHVSTESYFTDGRERGYRAAYPAFGTVATVDVGSGIGG